MNKLDKLGELNDQDVNIMLADLLGVPWHIRPEDNEDNTWHWKFSKHTPPTSSLVDYVNGCKELWGLVEEYRINIAYEGVGATLEFSASIGELSGYGTSPSKAVTEAVIMYILNEKEKSNE